MYKVTEDLTDIRREGASWLILKEVVRHHDDDERSRNYPGHGYPAHCEKSVEVHAAFDNEAECMDEMRRILRPFDPTRRQTFRAFMVQPYKVEVFAGVAWDHPTEKTVTTK